MLSPFTFHDIQRRVDVISNPATFQNDSSTLNPFETLNNFPTFSSREIQRRVGDVSKVPTIENVATISKVLTTGKVDSSTLNPFEPLLDDPSSFVSSLTSLHLHLSEEKKEKNVSPTSRPNFFQKMSQQNVQQADQIQSVNSESAKSLNFEEETDLFSTSFDFPDTHFGAKTKNVNSKNREEIGRSFPSDSSSDESRNNFFSQNPFQFNNPLFGGQNPNPGFAGQTAAGSNQQESLEQDGREDVGRDGFGHGGGGHGGGGHEGGGGGGGYHEPVHDTGGYGAPPIHDDGYGAPPIHEVGGYGHVEPVHDEGGYGGGDDHHDGGYSSHPGYTPSRYPGPYGYPTPNFKCEYVKETLYVSKSDWTYDEKCFTIYKTQCK